jgi:hypothetical protein
MRIAKRCLVYTLVVTMTIYPVLFSTNAKLAFGQDVPNNGSSGGSSSTNEIEQLMLELDVESVNVMEQDNCTLEFGGGDLIEPLAFACNPTDDSIPSSYVFHATSFDGQYSVLFMGGSSNGEIGAYWLTATSVSIDDAEKLTDMMRDRGVIASNVNPRHHDGLMYCSTSPASLETGFWDGFWEGYWHYLTNPSEMDDDLETGFYVALGTAAVAGTAAGGVYVWGAVGGPTMGAGIVTTSETTVIFSVNGSTFVGTSTGVVNVSTTSWATMGYWTSITGVPILSAETAVAGAGGSLWLANHPCLSRAIQAFVNGWLP